MFKRKISFFAVLIFISVFSVSSYGQPGNNIDDFVFRPRPASLFPAPLYKGTYIDQNGKVVMEINPRLKIAEARDFSEGLAPVRRGNLWGYIDAGGKLVVEPQFVRAEDFFDGLARVRKPDAKSAIGSLWGYIDKTGKLVYETKFEEAFDFSDGMALVFYENKYAYLTSQGKIAFEFNKRPYMRFRSYSEGLAQFCDDGKCGFMDKTGKAVIEPHAGIIGDFHDGLARFRLKGESDKFHKIGFIDRTGKVVIEPVWDDAKDFSDGVAIVESSKTGVAVINTSGKVIIDFKQVNIARLMEVGSFHEGLGRIKVLSALKGDSVINPLHGFIDKTGKVVITPQFRSVQQFNSGLAFVSYENDIGYIDKTGKSVWRGKAFFSAQ